METQTTTEPKESVSVIPKIFNAIDDARDLSVTSVGIYEESVDRAAKAEEEAPEIKVTAEEDVKVEKVETESPVVPKPKEKDSEQHRIDVLTKARREAERGWEAEKQKRLEVEEELKKTKSTIPPKDKPKVEDYETEGEFYEALTDWKVEQKIKEKEEMATKETRAVTEKQAIDEAYGELDGKMEKGRVKYADFNELVLDEKLIISEVMVEAILFTDSAEEILYYLGKNPEESAKIAKLPPLRAAHELGKIEAKVNAPAPQKRVTKAPDPITPVATTGLIDKDPSTMTPKEYREWREKAKK